MIIREEWDRLRLWGPQIFKAPWYRPIGISEVVDWTQPTYDTIIFTPECDPEVYYPNVYINIWDVLWRWTCQDCYAASGDRYAFKTDWEKREDLGGQGRRDVGGFSGPTRKQQDQMADHARQHSIMWSWVKGLK